MNIRRCLQFCNRRSDRELRCCCVELLYGGKTALGRFRPVVHAQDRAHRAPSRASSVERSAAFFGDLRGSSFRRFASIHLLRGLARLDDQLAVRFRTKKISERFPNRVVVSEAETFAL